MMCIACDSNYDIFTTPSGNIATCDGAPAVAQNTRTAMAAQRGEMLYAITSGMPMRTTAFNGLRAAQFEAAARVVISGVPGVLEIESFRVNAADGDVKYSATLKSQYGRIDV